MICRGIKVSSSNKVLLRYFDFAANSLYFASLLDRFSCPRSVDTILKNSNKTRRSHVYENSPKETIWTFIFYPEQKRMWIYIRKFLQNRGRITQNPTVSSYKSYHMQGKSIINQNASRTLTYCDRSWLQLRRAMSASGEVIGNISLMVAQTTWGHESKNATAVKAAAKLKPFSRDVHVPI